MPKHKQKAVYTQHGRNMYWLAREKMIDDDTGGHVELTQAEHLDYAANFSGYKGVCFNCGWLRNISDAGLCIPCSRGIIEPP